MAGAQRRLIVISVDGLSEAERAVLPELPTFAALTERGTAVGSLRSVFPSITYVVHASILTGCYPDAHGIEHNNPLQPWVPEAHQRWYWYADQLRRPTLFDAARAAGLKTAAVMWPLVGRARIDWNLPEIIALPGENQVLKVLRAGSPQYLVGLQARFARYREGKQQPQLDDFVSRAAAFTIRTKRPDLLMTHLIALDDFKHRFGSGAPQTHEVLNSVDAAVGRIVQAAEEAACDGHPYGFIVLGDHGHIDTVRRVRLNRLLVEAGIDAPPAAASRGGGERWRAWFRCSGGSAFLQANPNVAGAAEAARAWAAEIAQNPAYSITALHDAAALRALRCGAAGPETVCALTAAPGTQFVEDIDGPLIEQAEHPGALGADHGYEPSLPGYRSLVLAAGPGFSGGTPLGEYGVVDVAPTAAAYLGIDFPACDGRAIQEMLV